MTHSDSLSASKDQRPCFDREALKARLMDNEQLIERVIQAFLKDMPGQIDQMIAHMKDGYREGVTSQAHKIKGAAANIGGETLYAAAMELEQASKKGNSEGWMGLIDEVIRAFQQLKEEMEG